MELFICKYCGSNRSSHNSWRNHERCCSSNPDRNYKNGMTGKNGSNQYTYAKKNGLPKPKLSEETIKRMSEISSNYRHSEETKKKISAKLSVNNKGGRCKWYEVSDQKVQGTWERNIALKLNELNIKWIKLKTNKDTLQYELDGKTKSYTPDFYLEDYNTFLEVKGFWWGNDKNKMEAVIKQHSNIKIVIIQKDEYDLIMDGKLIW